VVLCLTARGMADTQTMDLAPYVYAYADDSDYGCV
jgi:hypothetical protein